MPCMNFALWVEGSVSIFLAFFPGLTECSKVTTICYSTPPPPSPSMHGVQFYAIWVRANFMVCGKKGQHHCTKKKSQVYAFVFLDHSSVCNSTFLWICVSDNSTVLDISAEWKECRLALKEENCWKLKVVSFEPAASIKWGSWYIPFSITYWFFVFLKSSTFVFL